CDHLHDVDVLRTGSVGDVARLLQRHIGEVEFVMVRIAACIRLLFLGGRAAAKRYVVLFQSGNTATSLRLRFSTVPPSFFSSSSLTRCGVAGSCCCRTRSAMAPTMRCPGKSHAAAGTGTALAAQTASHAARTLLRMFAFLLMSSALLCSRSSGIWLRKIDSPPAAGRDFRVASCLRIPAGTDRAAAIPAPRARRNRQARRAG